MKSFLSFVRSFVSFATGCVLFVAIASTAVAAGSPTTFVATNTLGYTAAEYTDLGIASAAMPLHIVLGLAPRNAAQIPVVLRRMATPGDPLAGTSLSTSQTTAMFGQTSAAVRSVVAYLTASGFTNVTTSADMLLVSATGTAGLADTAFNTQIDAVKIGGRTTFANVKAADVPTSLGGLVVAVEGLSGATMHVDAHAAKAGSCTPVGVAGRCVSSSFTAAALRAQYDTAGTGAATKTTLGVLAAGDISKLAADLRAAEAGAGIAAVPLSVVASGAASSDGTMLAEWDLDAQSALGVAGGAGRLIVYTVPTLGEADVTTELARFESDNAARAASVAFGICEDVPSTDGAMLVDDTLLALAALHGQTVFAAGGDRLAGCAGQQYPASSPYAIGVGSTTVVGSAAGGSVADEVAWTATAGGPSAFESAPFWQPGIEPATAAAAGMRAVPDLALDGDPNTGLRTIVRSASLQLGGSSLATGVALGIWGRLESAHGNALGFAAPRLYHEYAALRTAADASPPPGAIEQIIGGFRDLLVGASGLPAAPEDDFASGLGSIDARLQNLDILR